jgi:hypothetical protein
MGDLRTLILSQVAVDGGGGTRKNFFGGMAAEVISRKFQVLSKNFPHP